MTTNRGIALVLVLVTIAVGLALALGLALTSTTERLAGANHADSLHAANAAETALHVAAHELGLIADWDQVLGGSRQSRYVAGSAPVDLDALTSVLTCGRPAACTEARRTSSTAERPWGGANPVWRVFLRAPLSAFLHIPAVTADMYVVAWVGDDARETDGDPTRDGLSAVNGRDIVRIRAEAFARTGARHAVEADVVRRGAGIHVQNWRVGAGVVP